MKFATASRKDVATGRGKYTPLFAQVKALRPGKCVLVPIESDDRYEQQTQRNSIQRSLKLRGVPVSIARSADGAAWVLTKA